MPVTDQNCALLCSCSQRGLIAPATAATVHAELVSLGWQVNRVPDLCAMAAQDPDALRTLAATPEFLVAACRPRATRWLLHLAGVTRPASQILFQDIRPSSPALPARTPPTVPPTHTTPTIVPPAWFPVIDYDRCTSCRQCVSFCAFGVYSVDDKKVRVSAPSNCKDNCPACARICPTLAIMFPKVADSPINGDVITEAHLTAAKASLAAAKRESSGGTLHSMLAARKARLTVPPHAEKGPLPS